MAEYKKKTAKKVGKVGKHTVRKNAESRNHTRPVKKYDDYAMKPHTSKKTPKREPQVSQKPNKDNGGIRVLMGTKAVKQRKRIIVFSIVCLLLFAVVLFSALTPTGPFEFLENTVKSAGKGSFPASVSGSELLNAYSVGSLTYTLTDTHAEVYNSSGKQLFSRQHEFNLPSLAVSPQRAIIYDRGGKELFVYNHSDVIYDITTEQEIYCADIGRNGTVAYASRSTGYASEVHVLNKNNKLRFIWYSANETVNNVAVSENGRRVAVSTVDVSGGEYRSKIYVFKYSSAEPLYTLEYNNSVIYSLKTLSGSLFSVVTDGSVDFIKWKNGEKTENVNPYTLNIFTVQNGKTVCAYGSGAGNSISVFAKNGKKLADFAFEGTVSDVSVYKSSVFLLSDGYLYCCDFSGNILGKVNASGYSRIFADGERSAVTAGNFGLNKFIIG